MKKLLTLSLLSILLFFFGCDQASDITSPLTESGDLQLKETSVYTSSEDSSDENSNLHRNDLFADEGEYPPDADSMFIPVKLPEFEIPNLEMSKVIDGHKGGKLEMEFVGQSTTGNNISIWVKLDFPKDAFEGEKEIFMIHKHNIGVISFYPHIVFKKAVKLNIRYTDIDLSDTDTDSVDFVFQNEDGSTEQIDYKSLIVEPAEGKLELQEAKLLHFSRYGWIRGQQ